ncbi:hypothetical protein CRV03_07320 [Arcobacter sp. F155]|uniref:siphovirus Gp157 family protein n=1 Tax=Arcobacter sp. F155 TaxID=2044512 RepID=UPI00100BD313|nr:siphovirus Gp157 family protein [Arcobacter sp. F155]RXJ77065.1 hypothetical protein CRV03_07320 [Arcobacter sp. F155]
MKLVNYALQTQIETLSESKSQEFFKKYIQEILEDQSKPYYQKADYVGLSLNELKNKIDYLSSNIKELQALKKKLSESLELAKVLTAQVLVSNGVDRVDGNIISSLTLTKESTTIKKKITIKDENAVMGLGFVKFSVDEEAITKTLEEESSKDLKELNKYIKVEDIKTITEAKVKVNTKRAVNNAETTTDEILQLKQAS